MPAEPLQTLAVDGDDVVILDQTRLPHALEYRRVRTLEEAARAIRSMQVRGAPLIGATAAFGVALALRERADDKRLKESLSALAATRPTAVNLHWALERMRRVLTPLAASARHEAAWREARAIADEDAAANRAIGIHGLALLRPLVRQGRPLEIMTHCNAGWLATVAWGTALAPVYAAHHEGLRVHVYVSETRPRNQGLLTAWELAQAGIPHTLMADNAAGHLLSRGLIDAVIVGADRIAANGDTANKIGTLLKALAARDAGVPFYVAAPVSTVDFRCPDGSHIPIEERDGEELRYVSGLKEDATLRQVAIAPRRTPVINPAFDVTPARLITAIVTERGAAVPERIGELEAEAIHD